MEVPYYVRAAWELAREYATRNPARIAQERGIKLLYLPFRSIYGVGAYLADCKLIAVNSNLEEEEQNLVIAHELAHFELHPEFSVYFVLSHSLFYTRWEYEANMFAAALRIGEDLARYEPAIRELAAGRVDKFIKALGARIEDN
ncbi:protein of unknown function [Thermanaeromonas toyohensis ToBE]|uniref:IrrE N-terminal-like domain-containing protein n=1 Tax=Thermanaeromonas toyohensis ToBE TaxID=698762 RepID=A0A1W1VWT9_9FIRM|nr:ImmA/IrrE family metallo-endopeptidase [Thermanaeromonas toyohensis]SMB97839.1 protein of unknown function [Thermanaeromonas toyohensis ToBE]